jgi:hypothetical protein
MECHSIQKHTSNTEDQLFIVKRYCLGKSAPGPRVPISTAVVAMQTSVYLGIGILVSDISLGNDRVKF